MATEQQKRKTTLKTSIKDKPIIFVKESVINVNKMLNEKGSHMLLTRLKNSLNEEGKISIKKSTVQLVLLS